MTPSRSCGAAVALAALVLGGCSGGARRDADGSLDTAASAAASLVRAAATDASRAEARVPSLEHRAGNATSGVVAAIRGGASRAEHAVDGATASAAPPTENFVLATAVKARLMAADPRSALATNVVAANGVVSLTGKVARAGLVERFRSAAAGVPGARRVDAHLAVDPSLPSPAEPARDLALAAVVRADLAAAGGLDAARLAVSAHGGAVSLGGTVGSGAERDELEAAVRRTPGVTSVDDRLAVR